MAEGNRHLRYKEALDAVEAASPGAKQAFYFGSWPGPPSGSRPTPTVPMGSSSLRPVRRADHR